MIFGIGTDLIEVERVAKAYARESFRTGVYTLREQQLIGHNMQRAAGNFAVKEAVAKAFGTGFTAMEPKEIEVQRDALGKPYVVLHEKAHRQMLENEVKRVHVSISNTKEYASAYVILEQ